MNNPLLTVITVVKDDSLGLARTQQSLLKQTTTSFEWLVVDSSEPPVDPKSLGDCTFDWVPPRGVYSAMNDGLERAKGKYVWFLNAGDEIDSSETLQRVVGILREREPIWAYGDVTFISRHGRVTTPDSFDYRAEQLHGFSRGRFPPHQGVIAEKETLIRLGGFDLSYRIASDYALFLQLSRTADPVEINQVLARFHEGGLSTTDWRASLREFHRARCETFQLSGINALAEYARTASLFIKMSFARRLGRVD